MRYLKTFILFLAGCALSVPLCGQDFNSAMAFESFNPYGDVTPSVESFAMTKYGIVSPSLYTGAMSYSIPLYTYSDPDFTIPISLDYNYDGYRPSMASGTVGLGWALNCGGVITREVRGIPDEGPLDDINTYGWYDTVLEGYQGPEGNDIPNCSLTNVKSSYFSESNTQNVFSGGYTPSIDEYKSKLQSFDVCSEVPVYVPENRGEKYDLAPDIFHFNFCGINGDFMIVGKALDGNVCIRVYNSNIPYGELSVEMNPKRTSTGIPEFIITDGKGFKYYFGGEMKYTETSSSFPIVPKKILLEGGQDISTSITAFRLYKIEAPCGTGSGKHTVLFNYNQYKQYSKSVSVSYLKNIRYSYNYFMVDCDDKPHTSQGSQSINKETHGSVQNTNWPLLETISIDGNEVIRFSYSERASATNEFAQKHFEMECVESVTPQHRLEYVSTRQMRLSGITIKDKTGKVIESFKLEQEFASSGTPKMFLKKVSGLKMGRYEFDYNLNNFTLPKNDTKDFDHWGYWNGRGVGDITNHVVLDNNGWPANNIYDQMNDQSKESNFGKAVCGAMCRICYPTGGESVIDYEGNCVGYKATSFSTTLPCVAPYSVGGIRVRKITNRTAEGENDSIEYRYTDKDGKESGVLMQMPRYAVYVCYHYRQGHKGGDFDGQIEFVSFSGSSNCMRSRDGHLGYSNVMMYYPDSSYVVSTFSTLDNNSKDTYYHAYNTFKKQMYSNLDSFSASCSIRDGKVFPTTIDRKNMRGLPLKEEYYDANQNLRKSIESIYREDDVQIPSVYYSDVRYFVRTYYSARSPQLLSKVETVYEGNDAMVSWEAYTYNEFGQPESVGHSDNSGIIKEYYKYCHQPGIPMAAKSAAVRTSTVDGEERVIARESYTYGTGNIKPQTVTSDIISRPVKVTGDKFAGAVGEGTRVCTFTYDDNFRLTKASFPGNAYMEYTWTYDGRYIATKSVNSADNKFIFSWQDLVGLSKVQDPSGKSESYLYDSNNRLMQRKDTKGNPTEEYHYHLENEQ